MSRLLFVVAQRGDHMIIRGRENTRNTNTRQRRKHTNINISTKNINNTSTMKCFLSFCIAYSAQDTPTNNLNNSPCWYVLIDKATHRPVNVALMIDIYALSSLNVTLCIANRNASRLVWVQVAIVKEPLYSGALMRQTT